MRLACARHLDNRTASELGELHFKFDARRVERVFKFFARLQFAVALPGGPSRLAQSLVSDDRSASLAP